MALGPQSWQKPWPTASVFVCLSPSGHVFNIAWRAMIKTYIISLQNAFSWSTSSYKVSQEWIWKPHLGQIYDDTLITILDWTLDAPWRVTNTGIILWMHQTSERQHFIVKSSLIGWAHTKMIPANRHIEGKQNCPYFADDLFNCILLMKIMALLFQQSIRCKYYHYMNWLKVSHHCSM